MRRNRKGFTLIELLAAIVLLGILLVFAAPTVLNLVDKNKNKIYVDVAKKLVAQAEYEVRAHGSKIEKPDRGNVIVLSMVYLDNSNFDNAPGDGEFIKEASFVVVKNTGSGLEYSATVVEKLKRGGYKGIELTSNESLLSKDSEKYVKSIMKEDIVFVKKNSYGRVLTQSYINSKLGASYCMSVSNIYNIPGFDDESVTGGDLLEGSTAIKSLSISPASDKKYNSFDAVLSVEVVGTSETRKDLKVYTSLESYTDALGTLGSSYGAADIYTKNYDFSTLHDKYDGKEFTIYVVVKDKEGNSSKKKVSYQLHVNQAPVIDNKDSGLFKNSSDTYNMPKATLKLIASDDVDDTKDLSVCVTPVLGQSCTDYKKYFEYFDEDNTMEYDFSGIPDGRSVGVTVYVKDTSNLVTNYDFKYDIYRNQKPTIQDLTITSEKEKFTTTGHLSTKIKITAEDDFPVGKLRIRVSSDDKDDIDLNYNSAGNNEYSYTFAGDYDGKSRNLTVYVTDEYGETAVITKAYQVYENKAPEILSASVVSDGIACPDEDVCPVSKGGTLNPYVNISVKDDIDYADDYNDLKICISEYENACEDQNNYKLYGEYRGKNVSLPLSSLNGDNPYDGGERTIYYSVMDSYGLVTTTTKTYKVYENKAPEFKTMTLNSNKNPDIDEEEFVSFLPINLNIASLKIDVLDDWGTDNIEVNICKKKKSSGDEENSEECEGYVPYQSVYDVSFSENVYDGQEYTVTVKVKDKYGLETTKSTNYTMYKDTAPVIEEFKVKSKNERYSTEDVLVSFKIKDPLDYYSVCIGPSSDYDTCFETGYFMSSDGEYSNMTVQTDIDMYIPTESTENIVYLVVKDYYGNVVYDQINYEVYKYCTLVDDSAISVKYYLPLTEEIPSEEVPTEPTVPTDISAYSCESKCYRQDTNPLEITYSRVIEKKDLHFPNYDCSSPAEEVVKDCSFHMCYVNYVDGFYQAVGTTRVDANWTHEVEVEDSTETEEETTVSLDETESGTEVTPSTGTHMVEHIHTYYYKIYTVTYDDKLDRITFTEKAEKACPDLFDSGHYYLGNGYVLTKD